MNLTGCLRCLGALGDRPCANFLLACGQIAHQTQQVIADTDQTIQTGLGQTQIGQKHFLFFGLKAGDVLFELGTDGQYHCAFLVCNLLYGCQTGVLGLVAGEATLVHVGRVDDLLCGQQVGLCHNALYILVICKAREGAGSLALFQMRLELFQNVNIDQ